MGQLGRALGGGVENQPWPSDTGGLGDRGFAGAGDFGVEVQVGQEAQNGRDTGAFEAFSPFRNPSCYLARAETRMAGPSHASAERWFDLARMRTRPWGFRG